MQALLGGDGPPTEVFDLTALGISRPNSLDLPADADAMREQIRSDAVELAKLDEKAQVDELIATGYIMPHWPKPWGRAAAPSSNCWSRRSSPRPASSAPTTASPAG